jgi:hypothetical protein
MTDRTSRPHGNNMPVKRTQRGRPARASKARLDALVEEAIVDAHDESEQRIGLLNMIQENLRLPFETTVLGVPVRVEDVEFNKGSEIVAICVRGRHRQAVPLIDLPQGR